MGSCDYFSQYYWDSKGVLLIQVELQYLSMYQVLCSKYNFRFSVLFSELAELRKQIEEEIKASVSKVIYRTKIL